ARLKQPIAAKSRVFASRRRARRRSSVKWSGRTRKPDEGSLMELASAAVNAPSPPGAVPIENRSAPRLAAALVPSITGLRLSPHGIDAKLVNISATGLLAECGMRLKVGSAVALSFEGTFTPASTAARVVRCAVASRSSNGGLLDLVG